MMMDSLFTQSGSTRSRGYKHADVGTEAVTIPAVHAPKLPSWQQTLLILGSVGFVVLAGRSLLNRPVKRKARR